MGLATIEWQKVRVPGTSSQSPFVPGTYQKGTRWYERLSGKVRTRYVPSQYHPLPGYRLVPSVLTKSSAKRPHPSPKVGWGGSVRVWGVAWFLCTNSTLQRNLCCTEQIVIPEHDCGVFEKKIWYGV